MRNRGRLVSKRAGTELETQTRSRVLRQVPVGCFLDGSRAGAGGFAVIAGEGAGGGAASTATNRASRHTVGY